MPVAVMATSTNQSRKSDTESEAWTGMAEGKSQAVVAMLNKLPEVTLIFWIIKIMSTTGARRVPAGIPRQKMR
jgi:hypothetical protein